jgi:hypothetical protein
MYCAYKDEEKRIEKSYFTKFCSNFEVNNLINRQRKGICNKKVSSFTNEIK